MGFWNQLWLLCWKNFALRKRQKTRVLIELLWPLVIFCILVLVRIDEPPRYMKECHFNAKALPSAGLLPFIQSFVCGMNNECKQSTSFSEEGQNVDVYQDAGLSQVLKDLDEIFGNRSTIMDLETLLLELSDIQNKLPMLQNLQDGTINTIPGSGALIDYLSEPDEVRDFLMNDISLSSEVTDAILNSNANPLSILALTSPTSLKSVACDKGTLRQLFSITDPLLLDEMTNELCALTGEQFAAMGREFLEEVDTDQLLELLSQYNSDSLDPSGIVEGLEGQQGPLDALGRLGAYNPALLGAMGMLQNAGTSAVSSSSLSDLLINPMLFEELLQQDYEFNPEAVSTLLGTTVTPQEILLLSQGHEMRDIVCNTTALEPYIMTQDQVKLDELSEALCNMTDQQLDEFSENLRELLNYMNETNGDDLKKLLEEIQDVYKKIQELDSLKNLTDQIRNILASNDTGLLFCGSENGGLFNGNSSFGGGGGDDFWNDTQGEMIKGWQNRGARGMKSVMIGKAFNGGEEKEIRNGTWVGDDGHVVDENCAVVQMIESIEIGGVPIGETIWKQLKPMIQGYIFYAPDTNATRSIIEKAEQPLKNIEMIEDLAYRWLEFSPQIRQFIDNMTAVAQDPATVDNLATRYPNVTVDPDLEELIDLLRNLSSNNPIFDEFNTTDWLETIDTLDQLANATISILSCVRFDKFRGYPSEEAMLEDAIMYLENNTLWAGVVFTNFDPDPESTEIPNYVDYKIRQDNDISENTHHQHSKYWIPGPHSSFGQLKYVQNGFVFIQDMIEQGIIKCQSNKDELGAGMYIQEFPYPCYIDDFFVFMLSGVLPLFMIVSWLFSVAMIIKGVVLEKEQRLKEVMKVMGLGNGVHWVAWFIDSFIMMLSSSILLVILFKAGNLVIYSDPTVLLLLLISFSVSTIMLCFLISVFFSKANLSAACGAVFFFLTYVPFTMVVAWDQVMGIRAKVAVSLLNTIAFGYGSLYLALYEVQGTGIQWSNINTVPLSSENGLTMLQVILLMWGDAFIYGVLMWYIEAVHPGAYGMPRPWYFPFTRSYWCGTNGMEDSVTATPYASNQMGRNVNPRTDLEKEPTHLPLGVSIQNLVKIYKNGAKLAVDGLNVNFYEGQITSFLGHNGAGKTTTMSILTGLFPPTQGTAYIYNKNILTDINQIRDSLGMCPQHNVLFDNMTVAEHLWFYARLKGAKESDVQVEMEQMLKDLGLPHKRNELTSSLSGGMKRKLSIAIAFVAGSRTVILDEPTAGVDPYARREIWDLLSRYKTGRTIIMSTHHMDEADVLGDRIAIISSGRLRCCGSSLFLKSRFGNGYYLVMTKKPSNQDLQGGIVLNNQKHLVKQTVELVGGKKLNVDVDEPELQKFGVQEDIKRIDDDDDVFEKDAKCAEAYIKDVGYCSEQNITSFIQQHIPGAQISENLRTEISYLLPTQSVRGSSFEFMFKDLEANMDKLHISNFGISDTSLEEVFLTVTEEDPLFNTADTDLATDRGRLPRPFMGRGSLRRRDYRLSSNASLNKPEDRRGLVTNEETDPSHHGDDPVVGGPVDSSLPMMAPQGLVQEPEHEGSPHHKESRKKKVSSSPMLAFFRPSSGFQLVSTALSSNINEQTYRYNRGGGKNDDYMGRPRKATDIAVNIWNRFGLGVIKEEEEVTEGQDRGDDIDLDDRMNLPGKRVKGFQLIRRQFSALFFKRFHHARRSKKGFGAQVLLPVLFVCFSMMFATLIPPVEQPIALALIPWNVGTPNYIFYSNDAPDLPLANAMEDDIVNQPGIGVRCLENEPLKDEYPCQPDLASDDWREYSLPADVNEKYLNGNLTCDCGSGYMMCEEGAQGPAPPDRITPTTDILQNFTARNTSDYLVKTTSDFIWKRWGGCSFGELNNISPITWNESQDLLNEWKSINASYPVNIGGTKMNLVPDEETVSEIYDVLLSLATSRNVKVWWDNNGKHALPTYMNVMSNVLLRANLNETQNKTRYGITVHNHPLNYTHAQLAEEAMGQTSVDLAVAMFVLFALAFVPASFVVFLIGERQSKSKHLQIVSGVNPAIYWIANFSWDLVNYAVPASLTIVIFVAFQQEAFISGKSLPCVILLLILYGWAVTPMTYPAAFVFQVPSTAYLSMACGNMLIGIVTVLTTYILDLLANDDPSLGDLNEVLKSIFLIFPPFCLGRGLMEMANNYLMSTVLSQFVDIPIPNPFDWDVVGRNLFALFLEGFIFFVFTLLIEYRFFIKPRHIKPPKTSVATEPADEDVEKEKQRILSGRATEDTIRIENLSKVYHTSRGPMTAVDKMCVGITRGECFGLLGVNGAGKTTTFKMLTGDTSVSSGRAFVNTHNILTNMIEVNQSMGYCPQFDALDELLTGKEHLQFYARLRGVPEEDVPKVAEWGIRKLGLIPYRDRSAGTYSGGNKRKLSTAIALIGDPPVVFLDEPTTGMDPKARRFLWDCITSIVKEGRSVILTSHSMEECEALCTRVAIMVNGKFKCLGSTQHLKHKFGDGYTLVIRVGGDHPQIEPLLQFIAQVFPYAMLKERHYNMLEFQLPMAQTILSKIFGTLESQRQRFCIEDYSISQTTLDQVFIGFAKQQRTGDEDEDVPMLHLGSGESRPVCNNQVSLTMDTACARFVNDTRPPGHHQSAEIGATNTTSGVQYPTTLPKNINVLQDQQSRNTAFNNPLYSPGAGAVSPTGIDLGSDLGYTNPLLSSLAGRDHNLAADPNLDTVDPNIVSDPQRNLTIDPNFSINLDTERGDSRDGIRLFAGASDQSQC